MERVPPRIYCIPATEASIVAVFRRGPTNWSHVGRWDIATGSYEAGAWLGGRLFPRRSDLSPDGTYLCSFVHKPSATWELGEAYVAVSKLPWLTALHAFATCGTWTRGYCFTLDGSDNGLADSPLPIPYGIKAVRAEQFATERRRGWEEAPDCPPRDPKDTWDERRNVRMRKCQPDSSRWLCVESVGSAGGEFGLGQSIDGTRVVYSLEAEGQVTPLDDLQWADWDRDGRLLVATRSGHLQILRVEPAGMSVVCDVDLSHLDPTPTAAPEWATRW